MKKQVKLLISFALCAFLLTGCNIVLDTIKNSPVQIRLSGEEVFETITSKDGISAAKLEFKNMSFVNSETARIFVIPSDETKVEARYPSDIKEHDFEIEIKNGEIEISVPKQKTFSVQTFEITVFANIEEIEISGGVDIEMDATKSKNIDMEIKGGAGIYIYNIAADSLKTDVKGAAAINLIGKTADAKIEISGAGAIDAKNLVCEKAKVNISGAGAAEISVTNELAANIKGIGSLSYYGDPAIKNISGELAAVNQASKIVYGS